jgi:hypothetical protein
VPHAVYVGSHAYPHEPASQSGWAFATDVVQVLPHVPQLAVSVWVLAQPLSQKLGVEPVHVAEHAKPPPSLADEHTAALPVHALRQLPQLACCDREVAQPVPPPAQSSNPGAHE